MFLREALDCISFPIILFTVNIYYQKVLNIIRERKEVPKLQQQQQPKCRAFHAIKRNCFGYTVFVVSFFLPYLLHFIFWLFIFIHTRES